MVEIFPTGRDPRVGAALPETQRNESGSSGATWSAILAGAAVALAATLILVALGAGLGLSSISPWSGVGASAGTFTLAAAIWLIATQWISSGLGGYITGRLRAKWVGVHTHEVFFRDTAHGLLAWSVATFIGVGMLASATTSLVGGVASTAATVVGGAAQAGAQAGAQAVSQAARQYDLDTLFRRAPGETPAGAAGQNATQTAAAATEGAANGAGNENWRGEATRILVNGVTQGEVPAGDRTYLAQIVSSRTGVPQADAEKRVDQVIAKEKQAVQKAKEAADAARKATARFSIFTGLSLLIGAFIASVAAAYGGSLRDDHF